MSEFIKEQECRIKERLQKYNNLQTVKEQLQEIGNLSPYQRYKINYVSRFLRQALVKIENGTYGICVVCGDPIPQKRLETVPAALACVFCDTKRKAV